MKSIPQDLCMGFGTAAGRKELIRQYAESEFPFSGKNVDGEDTLVSISALGIVCETFQENGWVRVDYYDANGEFEGQTFDGRWR